MGTSILSERHAESNRNDIMKCGYAPLLKTHDGVIVSCDFSITPEDSEKAFADFIRIPNFLRILIEKWSR
jgi:hypothetical protein